MVPPEETGRPRHKTWGYWTVHKLSMLAEYLSRFTTASKKAPRTLYLDLFAGEDRNLSRTTGEPISGSPRVALETTPPFSKVVLFELPRQAARLRAQLQADYAHRDFEVMPGDCNSTVPDVLRTLQREGWDWSPTFALIDQYAAEIHWATLEQLSTFKRQQATKPELWLLFASSMLPRGLSKENAEMDERFAARVTAMFGSEEWTDPYEVFDGEYLRDELLNLMRWRLERELGYRVTHSFEMKNTRGAPLYNMIFATDHPAGERIMNHIYGKAAAVRPRMQAEAAAKVQAEKEEKAGMPGLFAPLPKAIRSNDLYAHEPPWRPYRLPIDE